MSLRKDRCTRRSPVTSGWKAIASRWLPRTATSRGVAVPGGVTSAKTSTPGSDLLHPRGPDEHCSKQTARHSSQPQVRLEGLDLRPRTRCGGRRCPGLRSPLPRLSGRARGQPTGSSPRSCRTPGGRRPMLPPGGHGARRRGPAWRWSWTLRRAARCRAGPPGPAVGGRAGLGHRRP